MSCSQVSVAFSISIFLFVSSLLIRFSLLLIDLALTVDNLMFFNIPSLFSSVVAVCLRFHLSILPCAAFLHFLFLFFLVMLFKLSSELFLLSQKVDL